MEQKIKFPQVGQTLPNGYTVMMNFNNRYIMAHKENMPDPYQTWPLDENGDIIEKECPSDVIDPPAVEQLFQAFKKVFEKSGPSPAYITIDQGKPNSAVADAQERFKYERCVKATVLEVYKVILQVLGRSSGRKWMIDFIKDFKNAAFYDSRAMRQAHLNARDRLTPLIKNQCL